MRILKLPIIILIGIPVIFLTILFAGAAFWGRKNYKAVIAVYGILILATCWAAHYFLQLAWDGPEDLVWHKRYMAFILFFAPGAMLGSALFGYFKRMKNYRSEHLHSSEENE